jgi:RNA polymerase sigma-70 factor (ECF subfamily)
MADKSSAPTPDGRDRIKAAEAMERYATGDARAFEEVYSLVEPPLTHYLRARFSRPLCEDVLQDTFIRLHERRADYIAGKDVTAWAIAIAHNLAIDWVRRERRRSALGETVEKKSASVYPTPHDLAQCRQTSEQLSRALDELTQPQRSAFDLVQVQGLSLEQAALSAGTTPNAVKQCLKRVREKLRLLFGQSPGDQGGAKEAE